MKVRFASNWLHPCSAALMLVSRRTGVACGNTLLFNLHSGVNEIFPVVSRPELGLRNLTHCRVLCELA